MSTIQEKWIPSQHYGTADPQNLKGALHTTQGADTIESLGSWFQNPSAQCSSHFGADNYTTVFGAYVSESDTAWTQGGMNGLVCASIELCGYAEWSRDTWLGSKLLLTQNAARWMTYIHDKYGIPYVWLNDSQAQDSWSKGFCQHMDFGQKGSGHWDCGDGFPTKEVMEWAKSGTGSAPTTGDDLLMSSSVVTYRGNDYVAYIDQQGHVCVNGGVVDSGSNAKSGVGLDIEQESGRKVVSYTNQGGKICTYHQFAGDPKWYWTDKGWNAR